MTTPMLSHFNNQKAASALLLMIIVGAVILILALSLGFSAIHQSQVTIHQTIGQQLQGNLNGCGDEALIKINRNHAYAGETLIIDETECQIAVAGTGANRTITIVATQDDYSRSLEIGVRIFPNLEVTSWELLTN